MRSRGPLSLAVHALARRPAFAASVVLTLGLGIGVNIAVFSLLDAALLRPLPGTEADRVLLALQACPDRGWSRFGVSAPAYRDWRECDPPRCSTSRRSTRPKRTWRARLEPNA